MGEAAADCLGCICLSQTRQDSCPGTEGRAWPACMQAMVIWDLTITLIFLAKVGIIVRDTQSTSYLDRALI